MTDARYKISPAVGQLQCAQCKSSDHLYADRHGTFCSRCGPSVPMERTSPFAVPVGSQPIPDKRGE